MRFQDTETAREVRDIIKYPEMLVDSATSRRVIMTLYNELTSPQGSVQGLIVAARKLCDTVPEGRYTKELREVKELVEEMRP